MFTIRTFESSLLDLFEAGALDAAMPGCLGREAAAAGIVSAIDRRCDIVVASHQCYGHFLAYCGELGQLYHELLGKPGGVCAGRGQGRHIHYHNFYLNDMRESIVSLASGMAMSEKLRRSGAITLVFVEDDILGEGGVYDLFHYTSRWSVPILFVIEDHRPAFGQPAARDATGAMRTRIESFGLAVDELYERSFDPQVMLGDASLAIDRVRQEQRPRCLLLHNNWFGPLSSTELPRDQSERAGAWDDDPLIVCRNRLSPDAAWDIEQNATLLIHKAQAEALCASVYS